LHVAAAREARSGLHHALTVLLDQFSLCHGRTTSPESRPPIILMAALAIIAGQHDAISAISTSGTHINAMH
jgi:hypothetical protein